MAKNYDQNNSCNISFKSHNLSMKGTVYFENIINGKKKIEGRVCHPTCSSMHIGDHLKLFDREARWGIICEIISKDIYKSFESMLRDKGVLQLLPQLEQEAKCLSNERLLEKGLKIYQSFQGSNRVNKYGAVAIGVKFIKKYFQ